MFPAVECGVLITGPPGDSCQFDFVVFSEHLASVSSWDQMKPKLPEETSNLMCVVPSGKRMFSPFASQ